MVGIWQYEKKSKSQEVYSIGIVTRYNSEGIVNSVYEGRDPHLSCSLMHFVMTTMLGT